MLTITDVCLWSHIRLKRSTKACSVSSQTSPHLSAITPHTLQLKKKLYAARIAASPNRQRLCLLKRNIFLLTKYKSKTKKVNSEGVDDIIKAAGHLSYDRLTYVVV